MRSKTLLAFVSVALLALCNCQAARKISYSDLTGRLVDLERLATLPEKGEKCAQFSSYDRRSRYLQKKDKYVNWDANHDGNNYIRKEGEYVLAEMEGPGCIYRIWSARPLDGHVEIYIDGSKKPVVDLPFKGYFNRKNAPFVYPSLVHTTAKGKNSYVPIPYQESCRIVAEKGWGRYYHFTYRSFPEGTQVPSFDPPLKKDARKALKRVNTILTEQLGQPPGGPRPGRSTLTRQVTVPAGEATTVVRLGGERAITALKASMDFQNRKDQVQTLRELVLRITWDGAKKPAVWVPLGDFFGTSHGVNRYKSLPMGMTEDGFYSYWFMPFANTAHVELVNSGDETHRLQMTVGHASLQRPVKQYGRFHCKWHRDAFLPEAPGRDIDWTMLKTRGRGRYCGVNLHVCNPRGGWWGEGDEKFFVDGEKFPSTFGTGSEDYFGYAWCTPKRFENAFHNQTLANNNRGDISVNRWHVADDVPFQSSFKGYIEKYFSNDRPTRYACTVYWYLEPGGSDPYGSWPLKKRLDYCPDLEVPEEEGALEAEELDILKKTGGKTQDQGMFNFGKGWSRARQLFWTGGKVGDSLVLKLPVKKTGRYELQAQFTKAKDYATVQVSLDGKKLGQPLDLYSPEVVPSGTVTLGTRRLKKGDHRLKVKITGANEKTMDGRWFVGLDWLKLVRKDGS